MKSTSLSIPTTTPVHRDVQVDIEARSRSPLGAMHDMLFEMQETATANHDSSISLRKSSWSLEGIVAEVRQVMVDHHLLPATPVTPDHVLISDLEYHGCTYTLADGSVRPLAELYAEAPGIWRRQARFQVACAEAYDAGLEDGLDAGEQQQLEYMSAALEEIRDAAVALREHFDQGDTAPAITKFIDLVHDFCVQFTASTSAPESVEVSHGD